MPQASVRISVETVTGPARSVVGWTPRSFAGQTATLTYATRCGTQTVTTAPWGVGRRRNDPLGPAQWCCGTDFVSRLGVLWCHGQRSCNGESFVQSMVLSARIIEKRNLTRSIHSDRLRQVLENARQQPAGYLPETARERA